MTDINENIEVNLVATIENNALVTHDFMTFEAFAMTDKGLTKGVTIGRGGEDDSGLLEAVRLRLSVIAAIRIARAGAR